MIQQLRLDQIRTDGGTQCRIGMDPDVIQEYAVARLDGAKFPPVIVFYDKSHYWLADGFYRCASTRKAGLKRIDADVRTGTKRDAVLFAVGANQSHGLRRSNADKRRAVLTLLQDEEWGQWSNSEIARRCGVHHEMVANLRASLLPHPAVPQDAERPSRLVRRGATSYRQQVPPGPASAVQTATESGQEIRVTLPPAAGRLLAALMPAYRTQADVILDALQTLVRERGLTVEEVNG